MSDGRVEFEITADGRKAFASIDDVTAALNKAGKKWEQDAEKSTDKIGASFEGMLKKIVTSISAAAIGKAILDWGKAAVEAASDLEEVQNVVDVTFGAGASKIEAWAKAAGDQFGLTETQAKRFTSTLGAMMKSAGLTGNQITDMSTDLAGLAADMASFYNLDFDTAFQKIRSGISGETEPLKQLGINMSVVNLNAFALQQGLKKTFDQMSQGEQVMLRYQYLMQATADAQGDFSRTSDGFANATRKLQTNLESLKTNVGKLLIDPVNEAIQAISNLMEKLTDGKPRTVLDEFADIDLKTQEKISAIQATAGEARDLTAVLDEIAKLSGSTEEITADNQDWIATCERLTSVLPGLKEIINDETGEIKGGTEAIREYIDAWEQGQIGIAMQNAHNQKQAALDAKFGELPGLKLDMTVANYRMAKAREQLDGLIKKYGLDETADTLNIFKAGSWQAQQYGLTDEQAEKLGKEIEYYQTLRGNAIEAKNAYEEQQVAYDEAVKAYEYEGQVIADTYGEAIEKSGEWSEETQTAAREATAALEESLKELEEYVKGVHDATAKEVAETVKGLESIETPAQKARRQYTEIEAEIAKLDKTSKTYDSDLEKLNKKMNQFGGNVPTPKTIEEGLQSQIEFMDTYLANLEKARTLGLSNEMLASLSDGSVESADYLAALSTATKEQVDEINKKWLAVQEGKNKMSDALTEQKLTVDQTYDAMMKKAKEAVDGLNLEKTAAENSGKTIAGIAQGIADHVPDVKTQVDAIIAQLERLNGYGIDVDFGRFGSVHIETKTDPKYYIGHRAGLNNVPYDGYLAELHQGEAVLTAAENRMWQMYKGGQQNGVDYDHFGALMRENVQAGGNVYLDGKTVGRVMSDQQGAQYRTLQRSGWQNGR